VIPRVLLIGDHFGYSGGVAHGVTSYYLNVLPALRAAGLPFRGCFLREPHPLARPLLDSGIDLRFLDSGKWSPWVFADVAKIARDYRPDIVHTIGMKSCVAGRVAARVTKAAHLVHVHDLERPPTPIRLLYRPLALRSEAAACVSSAVASYAPDIYRLRPERTVVLHNAIDLKRFTEPQDAIANRRRLLQQDEKQPIIGMVGRFHPVKGHAEMLDIFARIVSAIPEARLVLVGDGPTREAMEHKAAALGLSDKVSFLGQRSDIPELISCFDVLALPSRSEGLPIAAIEAMAAARAVVAFRVGGVGDIVQDGRTGCLAAPGDVSAFADAVVSLLNDPERRRAFSARAFEVSQSFGIPEHVRQLSALYGKLLDARFREGSLHAVT